MLECFAEPASQFTLLRFVGTVDVRKAHPIVAPVSDLGEQLDALLQPVEAGQPAEPKQKKASADWRPGIKWEGSRGTVTTPPVAGEQQPEWADVLAVFELDPDEYEIVEPVKFNAWHGLTTDGQVLMRQWKADVIRRRSIDRFDLDEFIDQVKRDKPLKKYGPEGEGVFCVMVSDWQLGKADGDGTKGTIERILRATDDVAHRVRELRRLKRPLGTMFVLWTGDSVEGCLGHYESQTATVELDRRSQVKVARRLFRDALKKWSTMFDRVVVVAVAGNHGENRNAGGKAFTGLLDNDDLAIVEQVAEAFAENRERYGHVEFIIPEDGMYVTVEAAGWILGVTHGHVARESGTAEAKIRRWMEKQAAQRAPIGSCDLICTGHYHHYRAADWGATLWVQAPAMDGGSDWWRYRTGDVSSAGVLTWAMYPNQRFADMSILSYPRSSTPD